jgi:poly(A) polymerase
MDELERRIAELQEREELAKLRPALDGNQIMKFLDVPPGPVVGEARAYLMDLRLDEGPLTEDEAYVRLAAWARDRGISLADPE